MNRENCEINYEQSSEHEESLWQNGTKIRILVAG